MLLERHRVEFDERYLLGGGQPSLRDVRRFFFVTRR
jgi:hypothetical protein